MTERIFSLPLSTKHEAATHGLPPLSPLVEKAKNSLLKGNLIAIPTDTIYGICCIAQCSEAVEKLYTVKGRRKDKPIAICVATIEHVKRWGRVTVSDAILNDLLPGAVTLVFERASQLNADFNPSTHLIGIRIPDYEFVQQLAVACDAPLALTSANRSDTISSLNVHEFSDLWDSLDLIFDGGALGSTEQSRSGSTVIDLSQSGAFSIIRGGSCYDHVVSLLCNKHGLRHAKS